MAKSPLVNGKAGGSSPRMIRVRCLRVKQYYPVQKIAK